MEKLLFLSKFIRSPRTIGSIAPSSRFLARAMTQPVQWETAHSIAELGAGTGVFTRYIARLKRSECQALIFEQDSTMRNSLETDYPEMHHYPNARTMSHAMRLHGINGFDYILSGLPFMNFPQELRDELMDEVERSLAPGGTFIAFQYSLQMKKQLAQRFDDIRITFVPLNIFPAFVYVCRKTR
ncbi:class I SAM-dependent methyltransferase [Aneurinibacillus uraniidurans]|uniref:class I SAM-dependent methyltransferase n=1 Tax=Aneurinibacillus uraniidurans TaxID=2966586 RepID=UPI0023496D1E|nr:methyltransferase domain-containing protein [Aneurinibacillus sp. B1]WCN38603.1 methyltransferase domain-containing protein [Aneurinibacillus sp. B1]